MDRKRISRRVRAEFRRLPQVDDDDTISKESEELFKESLLNTKVSDAIRGEKFFRSQETRLCNAVDTDDSDDDDDDEVCTDSDKDNEVEAWAKRKRNLWSKARFQLAGHANTVGAALLQAVGKKLDAPGGSTRDVHTDSQDDTQTDTQTDTLAQTDTTTDGVGDTRETSGAEEDETSALLSPTGDADGQSVFVYINLYVQLGWEVWVQRGSDWPEMGRQNVLKSDLKKSLICSI